MINCTFENGNTAQLRHAVVDAVITNETNQILLVKRAGKLEHGKWALPGGFIERGETAIQAAARETLEETGWSVKDLSLLMANSSPTRPHEDRQNIVFVFAGVAGEEIGSHDDESDEVAWFSLSSLPPAEALAFDHADVIQLYLRSRTQPVDLPVII